MAHAALHVIIIEPLLSETGVMSWGIVMLKDEWALAIIIPNNISADVIRFWSSVSTCVLAVKIWSKNTSPHPKVTGVRHAGRCRSRCPPDSYTPSL